MKKDHLIIYIDFITMPISLTVSVDISLSYLVPQTVQLMLFMYFTPFFFAIRKKNVQKFLRADIEHTKMNTLLLTAYKTLVTLSNNITQ